MADTVCGLLVKCFASLTALVLICSAGSAVGARRHSTANLISTLAPPSEKCYARNLYNSLMFKCKRPQPRAYKSSEVIGDLYTEGEYIKPCMTVLHRCDANSGCCMQREGMSCAPKEKDTVRLDFKIRPKFSMGERLISILAFNHTACECVDEHLVRDEKIAVKVFHFHGAPGTDEGGISQVVIN